MCSEEKEMIGNSEHKKSFEVGLLTGILLGAVIVAPFCYVVAVLIIHWAAVVLP